MTQFIAFMNPLIAIFGWSVYGLVMLMLIGIIVSITIDRIVRYYYIAKLIYRSGLAEMANKQADAPANGFADLLQAMKRAQEASSKKD